MGRMLVFCANEEHATGLRRELMAMNTDLVQRYPEYVARIMGVDGVEGKRLLEAMQDGADVPVIAVTTRLLSTGVDIPDVRTVVLFRPVGSMVEFKQIIDRGTRLDPESGKWSFDIIDFVDATRLFDDADFDGDPIEVTRTTVDSDGEVTDSETVDLPGFHRVAEPAADFIPEDGGSLNDPLIKYYADDVPAGILGESLHVPETSSGRLRLAAYIEYVGDAVRGMVGDADELRRRWGTAEGRRAIAAEMARRNIDLHELVDASGLTDHDPLDALIRLTYREPVPTRQQRADRVRRTHADELADQQAVARSVLTALLDQYARQGPQVLDDLRALELQPFRQSWIYSA